VYETQKEGFGTIEDARIIRRRLNLMNCYFLEWAWVQRQPVLCFQIEETFVQIFGLFSVYH